jgi:hypothetical protein
LLGTDPKLLHTPLLRTSNRALGAWMRLQNLTDRAEPRVAGRVIVSFPAAAVEQS